MRGESFRRDSISRSNSRSAPGAGLAKCLVARSATIANCSARSRGKSRLPDVGESVEFAMLLFSASRRSLSRGAGSSHFGLLGIPVLLRRLPIDVGVKVAPPNERPPV